jgi:AraC-like DNA-binding protein
MCFHSISPGPRLSRFVESFWLHDTGPQVHARSRALPTGTAQLVIDLSGDGLPVPTSSPRDCAPTGSIPTWTRALFNGADTRYLLDAGGYLVNRIGVDFKPGGAYPFLGPPAGELRDAHLPLETLWGIRAVDELRERLLRAQALEERCQILEEVLLAQLARPLERHPAVTLALRAFAAKPHGPVIARLTDQLALRHTRFIEVFRNEVGLSPKQYCRVRRFVTLVKRTWGEERPNWTQVALACGYYDQAHLCRDFQRFAGVSPGVYFRHRASDVSTWLTLPTVETPSEGAPFPTAMTR